MASELTVWVIIGVCIAIAMLGIAVIVLYFTIRHICVQRRRERQTITEDRPPTPPPSYYEDHFYNIQRAPFYPPVYDTNHCEIFPPPYSFVVDQQTSGSIDSCDTAQLVNNELEVSRTPVENTSNSRAIQGIQVYQQASEQIQREIHCNNGEVMSPVPGRSTCAVTSQANNSVSMTDMNNCRNIGTVDAQNST